MHPVRVIPLLLATTACTPVLTSPPGARTNGPQSAADWERPENAWHSVDSLPADLESQGWAEGQVPPDARLLDQNGDIVSLWQFYGDVIALDISTMWCGPCQLLAREVDEVQESYEADGFIYITMLPENIDGDIPSVENLNEWAERNDVSAPILSDEPQYSYDIVPDRIWPRVVIIGRDMRVAEDQVQPAEDAAIRAAIEAEL
ncbi:MAG: redoxin domain-containing protein [Myxococcota bacterium]|nr:redoxin domain-containing protein [Myxococcota bacterium]